MQIMPIKEQKGLGDTIEMAMKITGIHYIANAISNGDPMKPCKSCMGRKEKLNEEYPYGSRKNG